MKIPFGKFRGCSIEDTPIHHVLWCIGQDWFAHRYPELYEIARRRALQHLQAEMAEEERNWLEDIV